MTKAIRWTPEQLDEFQKRRAPTPKQIAEQAKNKAASVMLDRVAKLPPVPPPKRSKYGANKVTKDGITHDSRKEARRWAELERLAAAGEITDLQRQVAFVLAPAVRLAGEKRMKPALRYIADAVYLHHGVMTIEDVKSAPTRKTPIYRAKKHLMKTVLGLDIKEI